MRQARMARFLRSVPWTPAVYSGQEPGGQIVRPLSIVLAFRRGVAAILSVGALSLAMSVTARADLLFVTDASGGTVSVFDTTGAPLNSALIGGLNSPQAIASSGSNLFVT